MKELSGPGDIPNCQALDRSQMPLATHDTSTQNHTPLLNGAAHNQTNAPSFDVPEGAGERIGGVGGGVRRTCRGGTPGGRCSSSPCAPLLDADPTTSAPCTNMPVERRPSSRVGPRHASQPAPHPHDPGTPLNVRQEPPHGLQQCPKEIALRRSKPHKTGRPPPSIPASDLVGMAAGQQAPLRQAPGLVGPLHQAPRIGATAGGSRSGEAPLLFSCLAQSCSSVFPAHPFLVNTRNQAAG